MSMQGLIGNNPGTVVQKSRKRRCKPGSKISVSFGITCTDIAMHQGRTLGKPGQRLGQRCLDIAKDEMAVVGDAARMGTDFALEDHDLSRRQKLAQMIVGSTIAEAELKCWARQAGNRLRCHIEAGTLGLQTPDEAIQTAQ